VPVRDPEALAKAMLRFIENPQLVETMGRASRALAERRFDVNKINAKLIDYLGFA
jgi:glycosyltransferase involved in cell wall biosynthesis